MGEWQQEDQPSSKLTPTERQGLDADLHREIMRAYYYGHSEATIAAEHGLPVADVTSIIRTALRDHVITPTAAVEIQRRHLGTTRQLLADLSRYIGSGDPKVGLAANREAVRILTYEAKILGLFAPRALDINTATAGTELTPALRAIVDRARAAAEDHEQDLGL